MPDIEFVDDDAPADPAPGPGSRPGAPDTVVGPREKAAIASGVLLIGAAGLLVGASFCDVLGLRFQNSTDDSPADVQHETVDGWGRVHFDVDSGIGGQHATRFGIPLCAVAGVLVLLAAAVLAPRVFGRWHLLVRRRTPAVLLVALGIGLGLFGAAALELQNELDNADSAFYARDFRLHVSVGAFFWVGAAGLALTAAALVVPVVSRSRLRPGRGGDPTPGAPRADLTDG